MSGAGDGLTSVGILKTLCRLCKPKVNGRCAGKGVVSMRSIFFLYGNKSGPTRKWLSRLGCPKAGKWLASSEEKRTALRAPGTPESSSSRSSMLKSPLHSHQPWPSWLMKLPTSLIKVALSPLAPCPGNALVLMSTRGLENPPMQAECHLPLFHNGRPLPFQRRWDDLLDAQSEILPKWQGLLSQDL